mgnify:CR=1 FL=1
MKISVFFLLQERQKEGGRVPAGKRYLASFRHGLFRVFKNKDRDCAGEWI